MKYLIFNWKNYVSSEAQARLLLNLYPNFFPHRVVVAPSVVWFFLLKKKNFLFASQDGPVIKEGALTGDLSPSIYRHFKIKYVIIGHSERRNFHQETDGLINQKIKTSLALGLIPILCVGENKKQRQSGLTKKIIKQQIEKDLKGLKTIPHLIVAYEPIWAIYPGQPDKPADSLLAIKYLRTILKRYKIGDLKIIYGGSVNSKNILDFLKYPEVEGVLIGKAGTLPQEVKKIKLKVANNKIK